MTARSPAGSSPASSCSCWRDRHRRARAARLPHRTGPGRAPHRGLRPALPERRRRRPGAGDPQPPAPPGGVVGLHLALERRAQRAGARGRHGVAAVHRARPDARRGPAERRRHLRLLPGRYADGGPARRRSRPPVGAGRPHPLPRENRPRLQRRDLQRDLRPARRPRREHRDPDRYPRHGPRHQRAPAAVLRGADRATRSLPRPTSRTCWCAPSTGCSRATGTVGPGGGRARRIPTGDSSRGLGTGYGEIGPFAAFSAGLLAGWLDSHWDAGVDAGIGDLRRSSAHYGWALDLHAPRGADWWTRLALDVEVLGRSEFATWRGRLDLGPARDGRRHRRPALPRHRRDRHDYIDRVRRPGAPRGALVLSLGVFKALTDQGVRPDDWSPVASVEGTF